MHPILSIARSECSPLTPYRYAGSELELFEKARNWKAYWRAQISGFVRGDVLAFPDTVQQQFWTFVDTCTQRVEALNDPTYLEIEVYAIITPLPPSEVCGGQRQ